jgi:RimJ/RimL family protein N-acetyltransferase
MTPQDTVTGAMLELDGLRARTLQPHDAPLLQSFYEANPDYFLMIDGAPPPATAASEDLAEQPPAGMAWRERWFIALQDPQGRTVAVVEVISDLIAAGVWHIGLLIVATGEWGRGTAAHVLRGLEDWALRAGAQWLRLGVVQGNRRARSFWLKQGFVGVRWREAVPFGARTHDVLVMVKPLQGGHMDQYLACVARDRPVPASGTGG